MRAVLITLLLCPALFAESAGESIRNVMVRQQECWNRGDIPAFMEGYDNSESTMFIGSSVLRGHDFVMKRFMSRYPTKEKMGTLKFSNIEVHPLGNAFALVIGNFHLDRGRDAGGNSDGIFTLTFQKKPAGWKIIADHTSETSH